MMNTRESRVVEDVLTDAVQGIVIADNVLVGARFIAPLDATTPPIWGGQYGAANMGRNELRPYGTVVQRVAIRQYDDPVREIRHDDEFIDIHPVVMGRDLIPGGLHDPPRN